MLSSKLRQCSKCFKSKPLTDEYFYYTSSQTKSFYSFCKKCYYKQTLQLKQHKRSKGIPYHSKSDNQKRKLKRKIEKCKSLGLNFYIYNFLINESNKIKKLKSNLRKLSKKLNQYKPDYIAYYKSIYKLSDKDINDLRADNPKKSTLVYRIKYKYDNEFNLKEKLRNQLTKKAKLYPNLDTSIRRCLCGDQNNTKYESILEYTIKDLKEHLEKKFTDGMSWNKFKNGKIHIDHIKPQSLFDMNDLSDIKECWSLDNLQPLWSKDNLKKSNKYMNKGKADIIGSSSVSHVGYTRGQNFPSVSPSQLG